MDLGAFLTPGKLYPASFTLEGDAEFCGLPKKIKGYLVGRSLGRYAWLAPVNYPSNWLLSINIRLYGFSLDGDRSLRRDLADDQAFVFLNLAGRTKRARAIRGSKFYALQIDLLGRIEA